ncbi:peptidylprolyl isomerase [Pelagibius sp. CAU 1746]|uniref:peptidylprolyl isomerase n=1 Tax=Pelagibius sp. CAU 1746 TaxID=3140370 RepID=UPI00325B0AA2
MPGRPAAAWVLAALLAGGVTQPLQAQDAGDPLPLNLPEPAPGGGGAELTRLKDALREMDAHNPVVARVNGYPIRWAEVVASAEDLPQRYRDQIESVFPALLDRLVDLRLLAEAARAEGLRDDPVVRERLVSFEDRVLSSVLLERYLNEKVTTAALRARYDALVAARRGDREIRARHILVDSEAAAEAAIARLDEGAVFISLAKELSTGASAARGGDLGYFHPSRMAPAFAKAALALEPGEFTREPVKTEFGWHVILLVDRRADNIPSFLDMQDKLRVEARKEAVDRLVVSLRREASVEMFPEDALESSTGESSTGETATGESAQ